MSTSTHDLFDFFKKANRNISDEYMRICRRVNEDPGTAGDQGEENWKELLESWIPPYCVTVKINPLLCRGREDL